MAERREKKYTAKSNVINTKKLCLCVQNCVFMSWKKKLFMSTHLLFVNWLSFFHALYAWFAQIKKTELKDVFQLIISIFQFVFFLPHSALCCACFLLQTLCLFGWFNKNGIENLPASMKNWILTPILQCCCFFFERQFVMVILQIQWRRLFHRSTR